MKNLVLLVSGLIVTNLFAQNTFTAKVLDGSTMEPLSNVTVTVENSQLTAVSDFNGTVVLKDIKEGAKVKFNHIGFDDYNHIFAVSTNPELGSSEVQIIMNKKTYQA